MRPMLDWRVQVQNREWRKIWRPSASNSSKILIRTTIKCSNRPLSWKSRIRARITSFCAHSKEASIHPATTSFKRNDFKHLSQFCSRIATRSLRIKARTTPTRTSPQWQPRTPESTKAHRDLETQLANNAKLYRKLLKNASKTKRNIASPSSANPWKRLEWGRTSPQWTWKKNTSQKNALANQGSPQRLRKCLTSSEWLSIVIPIIISLGHITIINISNMITN